MYKWMLHLNKLFEVKGGILFSLADLKVMADIIVDT